MLWLWSLWNARYKGIDPKGSKMMRRLTERRHGTRTLVLHVLYVLIYRCMMYRSYLRVGGLCILYIYVQCIRALGN